MLFAHLKRILRLLADCACVARTGAKDEFLLAAPTAQNLPGNWQKLVPFPEPIFVT